MDGNLEEKDEIIRKMACCCCMPLDNKKKGLCELFKARGTGLKDALRSQPSFPSPPFPPLVNPFTPAGLKKRKKEKRLKRRGSWSFTRRKLLLSNRR